VAISHLTDLFARAKSRMLSQYRKLDQFVADLGVLVSEAQILEDALWAFFEQMDLDAAVGSWLDVIGRLLGETRPAGLADDNFRDFIRARIIANHSSGTPEELIAICAQVLNRPFGTIGISWDVVIDEFPPASLNLFLFEPALGGVSDPFLPEVLKLLGIAKAAGVKLLVEYRTDSVEDHHFAVDDPTTPTGLGLGFDDAAAPDQPTAGKWAGSLEAI
jgi:hypothetical protein